MSNTDNQPSDYITINIPKMHGYKTLAVNIVSFVYMVVAIVWPGWVAPDPTAIGLTYDQFIAALGAVITFVNAVLRLLTRGPVPEPVNVFKVTPKGGGGSGAKSSELNEAYNQGLRDGALEIRPGPDVQGMNALHFRDSTLPERMTIFGHDGAKPWPPQVQFANPYSGALGAGLLGAIAAPGIRGRDDYTRPLDEERLNATPERVPDVAVAQYGADGHLHDFDADGVCRLCHALSVEQAMKLDAAAEAHMRLNAVSEKLAAERAVDALAPHYEDMVTASGAQHVSRLKIVLAFLVPLLTPSLLLGAGTGVAMLAGCSTVQQVNAVAAAETLEQRAFALYGSYVTLQERAADIVRDTSVPKSTRKAIQAADKVAHPAAQAVLQGVREVAATRKALQAIPAGEDSARAVARVEAVTAALQRSVVTLGPRIEALSRAIAAARG